MPPADPVELRLDMFLWCARFIPDRAACARLVEGGAVRINRQPTGKPHARVRVGDVLTLRLRTGVRVIKVTALSARRLSAPQARLLYEEIVEPALLHSA
jgi:ribosome-associated heat shock protein Hsp15